MNVGSDLVAAWRLLDRDGARALLDKPKQGLPDGIVLTCDLVPDRISAVALVVAARLMIERALTQGGLILTATGALSRADTRALFDATTWPDYAKNEVLAVNKVLNEADALPIHLTRILAQGSGLLRRRERKLIATRKARALADESASAALFALLFETAFWRVNLGYFDGMPVEHWPQDHTGIVLWCLSVAAQTWSDPDTLAQVCTIRDGLIERAARDYPSFAVVTRVLRPLMWFGLIESQRGGEPDQPSWRRPTAFRKSALFDAVVSFRVKLQTPPGPMH